MSHHDKVPNVSANFNRHPKIKVLKGLIFVIILLGNLDQGDTFV